MPLIASCSDAACWILPFSDKRVRGTIEAIERELMQEDVGASLSAPRRSVDGLPGREGVFLPCSSLDGFLFAWHLSQKGSARCLSVCSLFETISGCLPKNTIRYEASAREFSTGFYARVLINTAFNLKRPSDRDQEAARAIVLSSLAVKPEAIEKRDGGKNSEAAVDQCPEKRDAAIGPQMSARTMTPAHAARPNAQNGSVSDRVNKRKNEESSDDEMSEAQPVRRVTKEWKSRIRLQNSRVNVRNEVAEFSARTKPPIGTDNSHWSGNALIPLRTKPMIKIPRTIRYRTNMVNVRASIPTLHDALPRRSQAKAGRSCQWGRGDEIQAETHERFIDGSLAASRFHVKKCATLGIRVVDLLAEHFANVQDGPVGAKADPAQMISLFDRDPPDIGREPNELLAQLERDVFRKNLHVITLAFFAFVPGPNNFVSTMADALAAGLNILMEPGSADRALPRWSWE